MTLGNLPSLPSLTAYHANLISAGGGDTSGGGGDTGSFPSGGGGGGTTTTTTTTATPVTNASFNPLSWFGLDFARILFVILGVICIIGAIYLFKPTSEIIAGPARAVGGAVKAGAAGAAAA